jgi:hypothetical protein
MQLIGYLITGIINIIIFNIIIIITSIIIIIITLTELPKWSFLLFHFMTCTILRWIHCSSQTRFWHHLQLGMNR